jgi:hypothetical protein
MGYEVHVGRAGGMSISASEWGSAIASIDGVRKTRDGAEVLFATDGQNEWIDCIGFNGHSASCKAVFFPGDASNPVWNVMCQLTRALGAQLTGDEGEIYNLDTGEVIS